MAGCAEADGGRDGTPLKRLDGKLQVVPSS
jgi:hypothetical protein